MVGGSYWFSDKLAIRAARAVPVSEQQMPQYYAIVRDLADRAGMPMPKLYVTPRAAAQRLRHRPQPQARGRGRDRGHPRVCSWDELRGVLAHELGHVANRDILIGSVAAALAVGITYLVQIMQLMRHLRRLRAGRRRRAAEPLRPPGCDHPGARWPPCCCRWPCHRGREYGADRYGARLLGDGEPLARALAKLEAGAQTIPSHVDPAHAQMYIVNPLAGRRMTFRKLFMTHPPTDDRIRRLRAREWSSA